MGELIKNTFTGNTSPFRYDVVGSYLRPAALKEARRQFVNGVIEYGELKAVEDREIAKLVQKQKEAGLKAVTDGEFRRSWWHLDFMWGFRGVEKTRIEKGYVFHGEVTRGETARLSGKIDGAGHPFVEHYRFLKRVAGDSVLARQTLPAPAQFLAELQRPENQQSAMDIYPSIENLISDIGAAYRSIIHDLYDAGCRNIQLDDCTWGMFCDPQYWARRGNGETDVDKLADLYVNVNNLAITGHPDDLTITTHVCRGNYHSTWAATGGYAPIAPVLFGKENVSAYYLEFDTDRCGDFTPLRYVPDDKMVILGLITSKDGTLEEKALIIERIREAAQYVDLERLCLSPQCGFASTEEGNILTEEQQWAKIGLVKEIAGEVWR